MIKIDSAQNDKYYLEVDGQVFEEKVKVNNSKQLGIDSYLIFIKDSSLSQRIMRFRLYDFPRLEVLSLKLELPWLNKSVDATVWFLPKEVSFNNRNFKVSVSFNFDLISWSESYSLEEFFSEINKIVEDEIYWEIIELQINDSKEGLIHGFSINSKIDLLIDSVIYIELEKLIEKIKKIFQIAKDNLLFKDAENLTSVLFNFPDQLKVACKQYLIYFSQFLEDLGINSTTKIKEEAGKVLFSVTPTDDVEALGKIREALAVYLNLPASPIVYDESFAAMRLQQQVENLQHSQKMAVREIRASEREMRLAQTVIEHQDKIIVQKDTIIEQQNKVIEKIQSKSIMMDSLENKEELEELYEGLKIGESKFLKEQLGIHLNPAKVIRTAVKNTFGKEDKGKSILGLDEEN